MRRVYVILQISLVALFVNMPIHAYDFHSGGLYYKILENGKDVAVVSGSYGVPGFYNGVITIPETVEYNGNTYNVTTIRGGFWESDITSITIPRSITSIGCDVFEDSWVGSVHISDLEAWCKIDFEGLCANPLYSGSSLFLNGQVIKDLVIPNSLTCIGSFTFCGCYLSSVTIPESVKSIGTNAFRKCSMTSITIPNSVTSIGNSAFYGCSGLTSITIPNNVTNIEDDSFYGCSGLTTVTIPNSVRFIDGDVFSGCNSITTVVSEMVEPCDLYPTAFSSDMYEKAELIVPKGTKELYQTAKYWSSFKMITEKTDIGKGFEYDGIYYIIGENNTVSVTANGGSEDNYKYYFGDVVIPSQVTYNGTTYTVTKIGNCAFWYCSNLTSITIPNSVTYIGEDAFLECNNLTAVHISDLEAWFKVNIHQGSISYGGYSIDWSGNPLYYAHHLYLNGEEVTKLEIPNTTTKIDNYCFEGWSGLTSVTIPNSVTKIGERAFSGCSGLISIVSEIKNPFEIEDFVFYSSDNDIYATAILTVPAGTKSLYQSTAGWNKFKNVVEASGGGAIGQVFEYGGINYKISDNNTVSVTKTSNHSGNIVIPKQVSFNGVVYIVTSIEEHAFSFPGADYSMTSITIPESIKSIGSDAFSDSPGLTAVFITNLEAWCNISFGGDGSNPLQWANHLYLNGTEIKDLVIPNSMTSISSCTFWGCSGMKSVTIPSSVTSIGTMAFYRCSGLTAVHISDLEAWCKISFNDSNPLMYAHHLFLNGEEITELNIPKSITRIKSHSFNGCHGLTSVTIPDNVTSIGDYAFANCNNLTSVILEIKNPFAIGGTIFSSTENDKDIYAIATLVVPAGTKSLYQSTAGWNKFQNIVEVSEIGQIFESDGIYYRIGENNTVSVTSGDTKYSGDIVIPSQVSYMNKIYDVTSIGDWAFGYCYSLTSVEIPNSVKSIGFGAFNTCRKLKSITIPSSVINIGYEGFCDCMGLTSVHIMDLEAWCKISFSYEDSQPLKCAEHLYLDGVEVKDLVIPNSITSIGGWSFLGCKGLVSVTIPNSVASIGNSAFRGCSGLTSIVSEIKNPFEISDDVFLSYDKDIYATVTLTVPKGTKSLYQSTAGWNKFQNIVEASGVGTEFEADGIRYKMCENNSVSVIQRSNRSSYGDVVIPSHVSYDGFNYIVTAIDDYAFCSCDIGGKMYYEDLIMTSITIPSTIKSIGVDAFADRMGLNAVYITDLDAWCNIQFHGEDSNPLYYAHHLFLNGIEIKDLVIPNSVTSISDGAFMGSSFTSITIPASVTRIGSYAFKECSGLNAVNITDLEAWFNISFESNPLYHAHHLFLNGTEITELIVPKSISRIGSKSFQGCSGLTSVTIPNNITGIEDYAFSYCNGLTSIILEIKNPFSIDESTFLSRESEKDIYTSATLVVPAGTKSLYQSTAGWNKFQNIVEDGTDNSTFEASGISYFGTASALTAVVQSVNSELKDVVIPESVYYNGKTYQVTAVADNAFSDLDVNYISIPASVTSVTDKTFSRCNMGALIWNAETTLPGNTFSNASMGIDANFLLYVKSASYAPSTVKNVVANGIASSVLLSDDGGKFYCPEQFKANIISYTHYYNMETGGNGKGWETIALPFDVQKISHSTRGEIIPFAAYRSGSSQKPFWLANFTVSGFKRTSAILANEPYIIAMPNSSNYNNEYNLAGGVTFSSENIVVPKTPTFSGTFLPAFDVVSKSSSVMALNVRNRNVSYTGSDDAGSRFISDLRAVRPYEAYMVSSTRGVYVINSDDDTTDMEEMLIFADEYSEIIIHTLSGQQISRTTQHDFEQVWQQLHKGVYIVNGKKMIK